MALLQNPGKVVIQICWTAPGPWISATVNVCPGSIRTDGDTFQPRPRCVAATAPVPSAAIPPAPFAPVKFSALIERDFARERRARLPMPRPRPLNGCVIWLLLPVVVGSEAERRAAACARHAGRRPPGADVAPRGAARGELARGERVLARLEVGQPDRARPLLPEHGHRL